MRTVFAAPGRYYYDKGVDRQVCRFTLRVYRKYCKREFSLLYRARTYIEFQRDYIIIKRKRVVYHPRGVRTPIPGYIYNIAAAGVEASAILPVVNKLDLVRHSCVCMCVCVCYVRGCDRFRVIHWSVGRQRHARSMIRRLIRNSSLPLPDITRLSQSILRTHNVIVLVYNNIL